jgi:hypothetical protein
MKNSFAILIILVLTGSQVFSQQFQMGPRIGALIGFSSFGDKDVKEEFNSFVKPGFIAGYMISFPLKNDYSFAVDFNYAQKGRTLKFDDREWTNNVTYNYLEGSMLLRKAFDLTLADGVKGKSFINIGPNISYMLGGSGVVRTSSVSQPYTLVFDEFPTGDFSKMYYNNFNRWLFGLDMGAGFWAPITKNQLILTELRFLLGHTYFGQADSAFIDILGFKDNMEANYRVISLTLTYVFEQDLRNSRKGKSTLEKRLKKIR